jgi:Ser/Thr protein kinase RdoA (MazF antagonist)
MSLNPLLGTPVAPMSESEAEALALDIFGVAGSARPLTSERDQNFLLTTPDRSRFVLKIANPAEAAAVTQFQAAALAHVAEVDPDLPTPRVVRTRRGEISTLLTRPGEAPRVTRMLTFLPGKMMHEVESTPTLRRNIGATHARLGLALAGFSHPASDHDLPWDMKRAGRLTELRDSIPEPSRRALVDEAMDRFTTRIEPRLGGLRSQVVHNDLNQHNLVVDPVHTDQVAGILDFGDMVRAPLACDVAVAAAYMLSDIGDPLEGAAPYVAGYNAVSRLRPEEADLLADMVATRLLMTVLITGWRAEVHPHNRAYILRNNAPAWSRLEKLMAWDRSAGDDPLRSACGGGTPS